MPRCERAQSSTTRNHVPTTVRVCMLRRIETYMDAHRVLGGLIHDPALLQAVALGYESDDVLLAASAKRTSTGSAAAARAQEARPVGRTPVAHCTVSVPCHVCMGLRTVHRLRVCVSTFTCMLACVTGLSSGHGTVRIQLSDRWFGPRVSRVRVYVPRAYLYL